MCYIGIHGTAWRSTGILVHSDGQISSVAAGSAIHLHENGKNENYTSIQSLINKLISSSEYSQINVNNCRCLCIGTPGIRSSVDKQEMQGILSAGGWTGINQVITNEGSITLYGGALTDRGIAIVCGSGSSVYGKDIEHKEWEVGSWGTAIGDEGSGYEIARSALKAIAHSEEGTGEDCPNLTHKVMGILKLDSIDALLRWADIICTMGSPVKLAGIVPAVISAAEVDGDEVAKNILGNAAEKLLDGFKVVRSKLKLDGNDYPVILEGEVIENSYLLRDQLEKQIQEIDINAQISFAQYRPVIGAALMAMASGENWPSTKSINGLIKAIKKQSKQSSLVELLKGPLVNSRKKQKQRN